MNLIHINIFAQVITLAFPIIELIMANKYRDHFFCVPSSTLVQQVGVFTWFVVLASIQFFHVISFITFLISFMERATLWMIIGAVSTAASLFFLVGWTITGSVLFWRDCYHDGALPGDIVNLFWVVLIYNLITSAIVINRLLKVRK